MFVCGKTVPSLSILRERFSYIRPRQTLRHNQSARRLDYIRSIFSNDALIITESVLKSSGTGERVSRNKEKVKFTRHSKDYFFSSYGDTGYLFLMIDLNQPQRPVIHVRTWQPEKDPDFGLIDLSFF